MTDERPEPGDPPESDTRRRAAWLLGMLAVVAALFVTLMVTLLGTSKGGGHRGVADIDPPSSTAGSSTAAADSHGPSRATSAPSTPGTTASGSPTVPASGTSPVGSVTCPTNKPCVLTGDAGNAIPAINAYRAAHGQAVVPVTVSPAAQQCALTNGSTCNGSWAETNVPSLSGTKAVDKIAERARVLDPGLKAIEVGWAYDPQSKLYYFAVLRSV